MTVCAFDAIDVLEEFVVVRQRSPTLRGDAPLRAVQACGPYYEGCGYGFELVYHGLGLEVRPHDAGPQHRLAMLDELSPEFDYDRVLDEVVRRGLLRGDGRWMARLREGWWWTDDGAPGRLAIWTGLLVRPRAGIFLRVTDLFNSPNLGLSIVETTIHDARAWTPLCVALDLRDPRSRVVINGPFAALAPSSAKASIVTRALSERPEIGRRVIDFYSPDYFREKLSRPPTRKYVKLLRGAPSSESDATEHGQVEILLSHRAQQRQVEIEDLGDSRVPSDAGDSSDSEAIPGQAVVLSACRFSFRFTGRSFDIEVGDEWREEYGATLEEWSRLYGTAGEECLDNLTLGGETCAVTGAGAPVLMFTIEPLLRYAAPAGWSLIFEGRTTSSFDGLRGIVRSDLFHAGAFAYQIFAKAEQFTIEPGSALGRLLPVPNDLMASSFEMSPLNSQR